jgi:hypothetical protein
MTRQLVFIDGLGGRRYMRGALIRHFERLGYAVRCFDYAAASRPLRDIQAELTALLREVAVAGDYHAIGYSFGGVLLRSVLQDAASVPAPRRMVLLASPLKPMRLARALRNWRLYQALTGECGQLVADEEAMARIAPPPVPTACIAGVWPWLGALGLLAGFRLPHDGMVAADEATWAGADRFTAIRASHAFIPAHRDALAAASGWFDSLPPAAATGHTPISAPSATAR